MSWRLWPFTHEVYDVVARLTGLRDRLRCPACSSVGTWKPHGGWADRRAGDTRAVRRWLCKWCGHYLGPEGVLQAFPDPAQGCWVLPRPHYPDSPDPLPTPAEVLRTHMARTWPWRG